MDNYPIKVDACVVQAVAVTTFVINYSILLRPNWSWLMYLLTADFLMRYIHPKYSPIAQFFKILRRSTDQQPRYHFAPPKRFAVLIGLTLTFLASLSILLSLVVMRYIFISMIITASFFQGFLGYCIGCELYNWLIQIGIIRSSEGISPTL